jgi:CO dehydrogenase maturation factor
MAEDLKIKRVFIVGNKIHNNEEIEFIKKEIKGLELLGFVWYNSELIDKVDKKCVHIYTELKNKLIENISWEE